ncbi:MAG TPA: tetratricopeptide repeat protein [Hyphomicrobiales bacterium]|nr:tetratricopeptide repeat protein [Hyphomicrobiales bacterium]
MRPRRQAMVLACLGILATMLLGAAAAPRESDGALCDHSQLKPDAAIPACTRLIEKGGSDTALAALFNNRGIAKLKLDDPAGALADFSEALNRSPRFVGALLDRAITYHRLGQYNNAISDLNQALRIDRTSAPLYNQRGASLWSKGEYDLAIQDFDAAIKLKPDYAAAFTNRALAWWSKRQIDRAVADFDQVIRLTPNDPVAYIDRAAALMDAGKLDAAIADYDRAAALDPRNGAILSKRGEAYRLEGKLDRALADQDKAVALSPSPETYTNRALTWRDKGELAKAIDDCAEAIVIDPNFYLAYANRGDIWRERGDLYKALGDLDRAVALSPQQPQALTFRGDVYRERGEYERALSDFNEALRNVPDFVAAFVGRGQTFERLGQLDRAAADYRKALSLPSAIDAGLAQPAQAVARTRLAAVDAARAKAGSAAAAEPSIAQALAARTRAIGKRVALVIGNSGYLNAPELPNPRHDAHDIAAALRQLDFSVIEAEDQDRKEMQADLARFAAEAPNADTALVYYAGHGFQFDGRNYLVPVDARLADPGRIGAETIQVDDVIEALAPARQVRILILDACRNDPLAAPLRNSPRFSVGLARIAGAQSVAVMYATQPNREARDGTGRNSVFTRALLNEIGQPNLELAQMFRRVISDVARESLGEQIPELALSLGHEFYFRPTSETATRP